MTSTPQEPLEQPADAGDTGAAGAPVSGSPAEADSDVGYSRGDEGESAEQVGSGAGEDGGTDYLDPGNPGNL